MEIHIPVYRSYIDFQSANVLCILMQFRLNARKILPYNKMLILLNDDRNFCDMTVMKYINPIVNNQIYIVYEYCQLTEMSSLFYSNFRI